MLHYQKDIFDKLINLLDPCQKRFLEIGGAPNQSSIARELLCCGASQVVQINNRTDLPDQGDGGLIYLQSDARKTHFENESFDAVYGAAVLEHLQDIPDILTEIFRVLKPGGIACMHGGPIWSSRHGHHVWVHLQEGVKYEFTGNNPIPNWGHLYMSSMEMRQYLVQQGIPDAHSDKICEWIYVSDQINRYTVDDYTAIFSSTPFESVTIDKKGVGGPDNDTLRLLRSGSSDGISDFTVGAIFVTLHKSRWVARDR